MCRIFPVFCLALSLGSLYAQPSAKPEASTTKQNKDLRIPHITSKPQLEEFLNGASRADMMKIDDFRQRQPGDGVPVSRKTSAWVGYDDKNFYAVFVCDSPKEELRARMAKREDIFNDDFVGVFLDTYHDHQRSYEFFVNPLGVQADGTETDGSNDDYSFDTLWYSEGRLTPDGFIAMMSLPFKSLRFAPQDVQSWGFGLGRFIPANNESSFWPYVTQKVKGFASQLGNLSGLENISPGRNLQLIPYAAVGHAHFLNIPAVGDPSFASSNDHRAGLEAKAVIHDSLSLDIALNPDFSQVESDDPQVTVNQRYAVQFPEKRAFFIENNGFFVTPENLFFSRQVVDPEYGARLTGKLGRWNLGFLAVDDRAQGLALGLTDPHYGRHAEIGVLRMAAVNSPQTIERRIPRYHGPIMNFARQPQSRRSYRHPHPAQSHLGVRRAGHGRSQTIDVSGAHSGGDAFNASISAGHPGNYLLQPAGHIDRQRGLSHRSGFRCRASTSARSSNT